MTDLAIFYEHPAWFEPLFAALDRRGIDWTKIHAGDHVFERLARMPFWEEYGEEIKSDVADIKNLGSDLAGQITAGKFLARFTTRPFIHVDIAGTAFLHKRDHYRVKGGTGVGVRLFYEFIKRRAHEKK